MNDYLHIKTHPPFEISENLRLAHPPSLLEGKGERGMGWEYPCYRSRTRTDERLAAAEALFEEKTIRDILFTGR